MKPPACSPRLHPDLTYLFFIWIQLSWFDSPGSHLWLVNLTFQEWAKYKSFIASPLLTLLYAIICTSSRRSVTKNARIHSLPKKEEFVLWQVGRTLSWSWTQASCSTMWNVFHLKFSQYFLLWSCTTLGKPINVITYLTVYFHFLSALHHTWCKII